MTNNETIKGNYYVRSKIKYVFGFADHQDNCTYGLGDKLTFRRDSDNLVSIHPAGASDAAKIAIAEEVILDDISQYVPHYTPILSNQKLVLGHLVSRAALRLPYGKRSSCMKNISTENNWTFELDVGDGIGIPFCVIVGFTQRDQFYQQYQTVE